MLDTAGLLTVPWLALAYVENAAEHFMLIIRIFWAIWIPVLDIKWDWIPELSSGARWISESRPWLSHRHTSCFGCGGRRTPVSFPRRLGSCSASRICCRLSARRDSYFPEQLKLSHGADVVEAIYKIIGGFSSLGYTCETQHALGLAELPHLPVLVEVLSLFQTLFRPPTPPGRPSWIFHFG